MERKQRKIELYISKYGVEEGTIKFDQYLQRRTTRQARDAANTSHIKSSYTLQDVEDGNAIQCMACGCITTRLQWTHFKHKCIDTINSIEEYTTAYPDAKTVAPNLAKETGVTKEKLIKLYGELDGMNRWNSYCNKQAITNTFEYKAEKHGWTKEKFDEYNASRAVTLNKLIDRHGEEHGLKIWESYCEKQRYTTSIEYFIEKYGEEEGSNKFFTFDKSRSISGCGVQGVSGLELDVYQTLLSELGDCIQHNIPVLYAQGGPFDMGSLDRKKLIEVYGTYWHQDPRKFSANDRIKTNGKTASEQWEHDKKKRDSAISLGYDVFVIWEHDWNKNSQNIITEIKEWWNNGTKT